MNSTELLATLRQGLVIPAHPLALTADGKLDEQRQIGLARYYLSAGAGGLAVGVHTTQFEIREPQYGLLRPVLELASQTARDFDKATNHVSQTLLIAGICGDTEQAVSESQLATELGYDAGLLSLAALKEASESALLEHTRHVAAEIPVFGFYLQPAVGGRVLSYDFWRQFVEIPNVVAIKIAAFNRYQTLDVLRAVAESDRYQEVALYTGNDDSIIADLTAEYHFTVGDQIRTVRFDGGLLGHWACWTKTAAELMRRCKEVRSSNSASELRELLTIGHQVTDMNAAIFDAANGFRGCIAGVHEVLRRQGLLAGTWCLDSKEKMSPGQSEEISRIQASYPELVDDHFVQENLSKWLT